MNNNIEEDYVSFETAKLLNTKGFKGEFHKHFWGYEPGKEFLTSGSFNPEYDYPAPTLQMAMKWLRIKHDIMCAVGLFTDLPKTPPYWSFNILNQSTANVMYEAFDVKCETYEEAAEASIKYCLENLV